MNDGRTKPPSSLIGLEWDVLSADGAAGPSPFFFGGLEMATFNLFMPSR